MEDLVTGIALVFASVGLLFFGVVIGYKLLATPRSDADGGKEVCYREGDGNSNRTWEDIFYADGTGIRKRQHYGFDGKPSRTSTQNFTWSKGNYLHKKWVPTMPYRVPTYQ